jgi:tetratricopeptide (TPR) repeat protein
MRFFLLSACAWGMLVLMAHLSWLWIHGDLVWMTALGLAFGLGLWHSLGAPERRGRRYFCRQLARLRHEHPGRVRRMVHHVEGLADGEVQLLVGRLRVTGAACESYDQGRPVAASTIECPLSEPGRLRHGLTAVALRRRADRLSLEIEGGTVTLDGAVNVIVGSQQAHPRRRLHGLPRLLCERVYRDRPALIEPGVLLREPPVIRNLAGGETVLVFGRLVADGASSELDHEQPVDASSSPPAPALPYRAPAPQRWLLQPAVTGEDQAPAIAALYAGAPAIPMSRWMRFGFLPMAWVAGAVAMLAILGGLSLRLAWQGDLRIVPYAGADTVTLRHDRLPVHAPALELAAATPFHRAAAIDLLAEALAHSQQRGRAIVEARVAAASLNQHCAAAADVLWQHRQPERAIAVAERCVAEARLNAAGDDATEADAARHIAGLAWMDLGSYERASAAFAGIQGFGRDRLWHTRRYAGELSEHAVAHVLAGAWSEAAVTLRRLAERSDTTTDHVAAYACLAEAASVRAGVPGSRDMLVSLTRSFRSQACALLVADLAQGEERRAWLRDPGIAWAALGVDSRGKQMLYLRELLLRESIGPGDGDAAVVGSADTLRLLAAGVPGGDTPYETLPALESAVLERLYTRQDPPRRDGVLRMAMAARAAGMAAHLGQHERAARWRDLVMADAEGLTTHAAFAGDGGALWRNLYGDALLLAAVTYWRAGDLERAGDALERARAFAPPALLSRVESVLALDARGELRASLAGVLTGRPADAGALQAGDQVLLDLARSGNGAALAELVADARVIPNAIGVLAPALASGHEALLDLLHWGRRDPGARSVAEALWYEGARAFAAERLGDHVLAGRVREAAHRRHDALARRETAVLVFLIEHL